MDYNKIIWFTNFATAANSYLKNKSLRREKYRLETEKNHIEIKLKLVRGLTATILHKERKRNFRGYWRRPKLKSSETEQFWEETVSNYTDTQFRRAFRITRTTFNYICVTLYPLLRKVDTITRNAIPLQKRIAITLMYLKGYYNFSTIACLFSIEENIVPFLIFEFCTALINCLWNKVIIFPHTEEEKVKLAEKFQQKWKFGECFGTLGYMDIPTQTTKENFQNENTVLLALVDESYKFIYVDFLQNMDFFKQTTLYNEMLTTKTKKYVISNYSFPLFTWLLTPYKPSSDMPFYQKKYNSVIKNTSKCIEEAICRLKYRWQILLRQKFNCDQAQLITKVCIILHNICEDLHEDFSRNWIEEESSPGNNFNELETNQDLEDNLGGKAKRDLIAKMLLRNGKL